jgi:pyruvate kinase
MEYEIVATLGPASATESTWEGMRAAGATGFRLNTSHLTISGLREWIERLGPFLRRQEPRVPLILDLQGSKWRLGEFPEFGLAEGQRLSLVCAVTCERPDVLPVPHADFFRAAAGSSGEITLDDAKLRLHIESLGAEELTARVTMGGTVRPRKGITYTASTYRQESLNDRDHAVLRDTLHLVGVRYALSYVKDGVEMASYRAQIGRSAYAIAKLERQLAVVEAASIAASADELWLCRGDLGAELGPKGMAVASHRFSRGVADMTIPVLLAGQVFEHLTEHPTPTRSELCAVYDALAQGYRGVVLSDETAIGRDPVESCRVAALFRG